MQRFSLHCCGVSDGRAGADRFHSAFLYRIGSACFLIDCGQPVSLGVQRAGLAAEDLDRLFVSHMHSDHTSGLSMLIQGFWLDGRRRKLPVHAPREGVAPLRQLLDAGYLFPALVPFEIDWRQHTAGFPVAWNGVSVTPFPTSHLDGMRRDFGADHPRPFEAFSFLIESEGLRIAHSADIGAAEDLEPLLERSTDLLVCELAHVDPEPLFSYLARKPCVTVCLVHLPEALWQRRNEVAELARRRLPGKRVVIPADGEEITLEAPPAHPERTPRS